MWICQVLATWILNQLLTRKDADITFIAENFEWYVFPSANPDGYQYSYHGWNLGHSDVLKNPTALVRNSQLHVRGNLPDYGKGMGS